MEITSAASGLLVNVIGDDRSYAKEYKNDVTWKSPQQHPDCL
jgi:hypothetical protein